MSKEAALEVSALRQHTAAIPSSSHFVADLMLSLSGSCITSSLPEESTHLIPFDNKKSAADLRL